MKYPKDTPDNIAKALFKAESTQFCKFTSELSTQESGYGKEYCIDAIISDYSDSLTDINESEYLVRLLIPERFPLLPAHVIPLDPPLKWYPHQFGDWSTEIEEHANVTCPPRPDEVYSSELLLPYLRQAFDWITDAINDRLFRPDSKYELPHFADCCLEEIGLVLAEGSIDICAWVRSNKWGKAELIPLDVKIGKQTSYIVKHFRAESPSSTWDTRVRSKLLCRKGESFWVPWIFADNPVVEKPHRPPVKWADFGQNVKKYAIRAIRETVNKAHKPFLLFAFAVPDKWNGERDRIVWQLVQMTEFQRDMFAPHGGYSRKSSIVDWPRVKAFLAKNSMLKWHGCTDISDAGLLCRSNISMSLFSNKSIAIIGVGAIGASFAKAVSKLYPVHLYLIDKEILEPGNLVRHELPVFSINISKSESLALHLQSLSQKHEVSSIPANVLKDWKKVLNRIRGCNLIADFTASKSVHEQLTSEMGLKESALAIGFIKPGPEFAFLFLRKAGALLSTDDALSALQKELPADAWDRFAESGKGQGALVWPEPGCYDPTFEAPFYLVRMVADMFLGTIVDWCSSGMKNNLVTLYSKSTGERDFGVRINIEAQFEL
jgi:ThiF family